MKGAGTKDDDLVRIIVSRSEVSVVICMREHPAALHKYFRVKYTL